MGSWAKFDPEDEANRGKETDDPSRSQSPAESAYEAKGPMRLGSGKEADKRTDRWGNLQDTFRDALQYAKKANLPPQYRKMIEEYLRKLAEYQERK